VNVSGASVWKPRAVYAASHWKSFETIHVPGEAPLCYSCFNRETAERLGIDFYEPQFQPIVLEYALGWDAATSWLCSGVNVQLSVHHGSEPVRLRLY
jgi:hypothetical protein